MAGHLGLPAKCAREREDKCKTERRQLDLSRNGHVRVAPHIAGRVYGFATTRPKSKRLVPGRTGGLLLDAPTQAVQEG